MSQDVLIQTKISRYEPGCHGCVPDLPYIGAMKTPMASPVAGFRFGAVSAGIRKDGRIDVALAVCDRPAVTVGLFTRNIVRAAPVLIAAERLRGHRARAVLANAGCANACTGEAGLVAARQATDAVAQALGIGETEVIPASTGVIGVVLPADKIVERAGELSLQLR